MFCRSNTSWCLSGSDVSERSNLSRSPLRRLPLVRSTSEQARAKPVASAQTRVPDVSRCEQSEHREPSEPWTSEFSPEARPTVGLASRVIRSDGCRSHCVRSTDIGHPCLSRSPLRRLPLVRSTSEQGRGERHLGPPRFTRGEAGESERERARGGDFEAKLQQPASRERSNASAPIAAHLGPRGFTPRGAGQSEGAARAALERSNTSAERSEARAGDIQRRVMFRVASPLVMATRGSQVRFSKAHSGALCVLASYATTLLLCRRVVPHETTSDARINC